MVYQIIIKEGVWNPESLVHDDYLLQVIWKRTIHKKNTDFFIESCEGRQQV